MAKNLETSNENREEYLLDVFYMEGLLIKYLGKDIDKPEFSSLAAISSNFGKALEGQKKYVDKSKIFSKQNVDYFKNMLQLHLEFNFRIYTDFNDIFSDPFLPQSTL